MMSLFWFIERRRRHAAVRANGALMENAPSQLELKRLIAEAKDVVDLGCGPNPVEGATVAVDRHLEPEQRSSGTIDPAALEARGIRFVNASIDERLPFKEDEFDFAHSSHVIEHVDNPGLACDEMMRIAKSGLLRCPAAMAEFLYGRRYHRWLVQHRAGTVIFTEKLPHEYAVFGDERETSSATVNPFEALIDWEGGRPSTPDRGIIGRLKRRIQGLFYGRNPLSEVNLFWRGGFRWVVIRANGAVEQGGSSGEQWWIDESGKRRQSEATKEAARD